MLEFIKRIFESGVLNLVFWALFFSLGVYLKDTDPFVSGLCIGFSLVPVVGASSCDKDK